MDNLEYEKKYIDKGYKYIAGVDEVGRGPLAGPVVCCAIIMPLEKQALIDGVTDSKKLSPRKRQKLAEQIKSRAVAYSIAEISPDEIDEINILQAVKKGMTAAVNGLKIKPDVTLVDGPNTKLPINAEYVIKGDLKSYTIGCASIVAKIYRDGMMEQLAKDFPAYGWQKNKGYGTKSHIAAIKENGPCKLHRKTFIKNFWAESAKKKPQNT